MTKQQIHKELSRVARLLREALGPGLTRQQIYQAAFAVIEDRGSLDAKNYDRRALRQGVTRLTIARDKMNSALDELSVMTQEMGGYPELDVKTP